MLCCRCSVLCSKLQLRNLQGQQLFFELERGKEKKSAKTYSGIDDLGMEGGRGGYAMYKCCRIGLFCLQVLWRCFNRSVDILLHTLKNSSSLISIKLSKWYLKSYFFSENFFTDKVCINFSKTPCQRFSEKCSPFCSTIQTLCISLVSISSHIQHNNSRNSHEKSNCSPPAWDSIFPLTWQFIAKTQTSPEWRISFYIFKGAVQKRCITHFFMVNYTYPFLSLTHSFLI